MPFGRFQLKKTSDYSDSVRALAGLVMRGQISPKVVEAARNIVNDCPARDDECELEAIWRAVRHGTPAVKGLARGVRYTSDPQEADYFTGAEYLLGMCKRGACGEDCDGQATMVATLAAAVGHTVGLRIWRAKESGSYEHIYAVALREKRSPIAAAKDDANVVSMDASTENQPGFQLGFDEAPPFGFVKTYWVVSKGNR